MVKTSSLPFVESPIAASKDTSLTVGIRRAYLTVMPAHLKDPAGRANVLINFKVRRAVKEAIETLAKLRGGETGDYTVSGYLLALVYADAGRRGVTIGPEPEVPPKVAAKRATKPAKPRAGGSKARK
jgi:hypothetical protein